MAGESGSTGVVDDGGASSPKNKIKFLCSHGGKILPRAGDGGLKYGGGETRVIAVPRDITFKDLMKKVTTLTEGDMVLKYQLVTEDLDALVTIRSDADLQHMFEEHDRPAAGFAMLRAFLFPSKPVVLENQPAVSDSPLSEQRYIDAINNVVPTGPGARYGPVRTVYSACSSPKSKSPDGHPFDITNEAFSCASRVSSMHRVRSSPSISSMNNLPTSHSSPQHPHHSPQQHSTRGHISARFSPDPQIAYGFARSPPILSIPSRGNQYYVASRSNSPKGAAGCSKCGHSDESSPTATVILRSPKF